MESMDEMEGKSAPTIWIVEVLQRTGEWRPMAAPVIGPFTRIAAEARAQEMIEQHPFLKIKIRHAAHYQMIRPIRIRAYAPLDVKIELPLEPNLMDAPLSADPDNPYETSPPSTSRCCKTEMNTSRSTCSTNQIDDSGLKGSSS